MPVGESLPTWRVALYQPDGLVAARAVRRQTMTFTGAFVLLLVVIVLGLAATYRVVRRESEMARLKSDFVANVFHDLKTPLSLIRMFAETLEMDRVPDDAARASTTRSSRARASGSPGSSTTCSTSRGSTAAASATTGGPARSSRSSARSVEAFRYPLAEQGFEVEVDVEPGLPELSLDEGAIGQALGNLVDNAIKYSGERRRLRVAARRAASRCAIDVADEGVGIPPAEVPRVFEKFYRVAGARPRASGAAGRPRAGEARGRGPRRAGKVESRAGEGSRFTLLPWRGRVRCRASWSSTTSPRSCAASRTTCGSRATRPVGADGARGLALAPPRRPTWSCSTS